MFCDCVETRAYIFRTKNTLTKSNNFRVETTWNLVVNSTNISCCKCSSLHQIDPIRHWKTIHPRTLHANLIIHIFIETTSELGIQLKCDFRALCLFRIELKKQLLNLVFRWVYYCGVLLKQFHTPLMHRFCVSIAKIYFSWKSLIKYSWTYIVVQKYFLFIQNYHPHSALNNSV